MGAKALRSAVAGSLGAALRPPGARRWARAAPVDGGPMGVRPMPAAASLLAVGACSAWAPPAPAGAAQPFEMVHFAAKDAYDGAVWRYQVECATGRGFT